MGVGGAAGVVAGGVAVDAGGVAAEEAGAAAAEAFQLVGVGALGGQQGPLVGDAPGVAGETAVAAHHPVAGDQHRDRVAAESRPDRPDRRRLAELAGHPGVRPHLAAGDLLGLGQHGPLELGGAAQVVAGRPAGPPRGEEPLDLGDQPLGRPPGRPQAARSGPGTAPGTGLVRARGGGRDPRPL